MNPYVFCSGLSEYRRLVELEDCLGNRSDTVLSDRGTLWLFNIAMENGLFMDGLPTKNGDFPLLC